MATVGFTGTRTGCTPAQLESLARVLAEWLTEPDAAFHHGCCVGADAQAVKLVRRLANMTRVVGHPGDWPAFQDRDAIASSNDMRRCLPNLERNRNIVDACDPLIACPAGPEEVRSGTWSTVRYARKRGKRVIIVWPDGEVTKEDQPDFQRGAGT